ncbi:unnamed protein product [Tenebrio molitor]|nr:unnamed protein product [Tenebrio molitor]
MLRVNCINFKFLNYSRPAELPHAPHRSAHFYFFTKKIIVLLCRVV